MTENSPVEQKHVRRALSLVGIGALSGPTLVDTDVKVVLWIRDPELHVHLVSELEHWRACEGLFERVILVQAHHDSGIQLVHPHHSLAAQWRQRFIPR